MPEAPTWRFHPYGRTILKDTDPGVAEANATDLKYARIKKICGFLTLGVVACMGVGIVKHYAGMSGSLPWLLWPLVVLVVVSLWGWAVKDKVTEHRYENGYPFVADDSGDGLTGLALACNDLVRSVDEDAEHPDTEEMAAARREVMAEIDDVLELCGRALAEAWDCWYVMVWMREQHYDKKIEFAALALRPLYQLCEELREAAEAAEPEDVRDDS